MIILPVRDFPSFPFDHGRISRSCEFSLLELPRSCVAMIDCSPNEQGQFYTCGMDSELVRYVEIAALNMGIIQFNRVTEAKQSPR